MRSPYLIIFLILLGLSLWACSEKQGEENSSASGIAYQIQLADSLQIPYLGSPLVFDIDPDKRLVFLHDMQRNINLLLDFDGNVVWEKSFTGDSPYSNGHFLSIASFTDSGFVFLGSRGIGLYDLEGNLLNQKRPSKNFLVGFTILNQASKLEWRGDDWLYRFNHAGDFKANEAEYYKNLTTLAFINKESGSAEYALPLPKESRFLDGKSYDNYDLTIFPTLIDGMLWAVFGGDPKLYKYSFDNLNQPLLHTEITYPKFHLSKGIPLSERNPDAFNAFGNSGQNELLRTDGKHLLLVYRPGFSKEEQDLLAEYGKIENTEEKNRLRSEIMQRNSSRLILFDSEGNQVLETGVPASWGLTTLIGKNGSFWLKKNLNREVEEDFFTLYRLEVVEK